MRFADFADLSAADRYKLLIGTVMPLNLDLDLYRPIGRLMGERYAELGEVFDITVPTAPVKANP